MRPRFISAVLTLSLTLGSSVATAQAAMPATSPAESPVIQVIRGRAMPPGTTIDAVMDNTIASGASRVGDMFTATIDSTVLDELGRRVFPAGSRLIGRIVAASAATDADQNARLDVSIDALGVRGGVLPVDARITRMERVNQRSRDDAMMHAQVPAGSHVSVTLTGVVPLAQLENIHSGAIGGGPTLR